MTPSEKLVVADVSGNVWRLEVGIGDRVCAGDVLIILESMKMEIPVEAPVAGEISRLMIQPEDVVQEGQLLLTIEPQPAGCP